MFFRVFSLSKQVRRSLRSSGPWSQVYGYYRMSFQEEMNQHKKLMVRVCNIHREKVRGIKTIFFLIAASMSLSSEETVPKKWRHYQDKIMTTTEATVENQEKTIQNKLQVLHPTKENTNKIAGSNFLQPIQRHRKFMVSKVEGMPRNKSDCTRT